MPTYDCICNKKYKTEAGMYKHRKKCDVYIAINGYGPLLEKYAGSQRELGRANETIDRMDETIDDLKRQIQELTVRNDKMMERLYGTMKDGLDVRKGEMDMKNTQINGAGNLIGNNQKALLTILQNSNNNAPALEYITDNKKMKRQITSSGKGPLGLCLLNHFVDGSLVTFLGDLLVADYNRTDPKEQSVWSTDTTRLTYLIRIVTENGTIWTTDKTGIHVKNTIIKPFVKMLKVEVEGYYAEVRDQNVSEMRVHMENTIVQLLQEVGYKEGQSGSRLANKINKYISSKLHADEGKKMKLV